MEAVAAPSKLSYGRPNGFLDRDRRGRMKLLTYESAAGPRAGVLVEDRVVDVAALLGEAGGVRDVRALLERLKAALAGGATEGPALGSVRRGRRFCSRRPCATTSFTRSTPPSSTLARS